MSDAGKSYEDSPSKDAPKPRVKRKTDNIPFKGWALNIGGKHYPTNPNKCDIEKALELAKAGSLEELGFYDTKALEGELMKGWDGNVETLCTKAVAYHARRVAYFVIKGWAESPIEVMANGDMRDGQHRLLAAQFMGIGEVDVVVF